MNVQEKKMANLETLGEELSKLSLMEASELVKMLEEGSVLVPTSS